MFSFSLLILNLANFILGHPSLRSHKLNQSFHSILHHKNCSTQTGPCMVISTVSGLLGISATGPEHMPVPEQVAPVSRNIPNSPISPPSR
ncbi:uncharacterized protein F5891DRAFT_1051117 [Suillus fuscotomentosus]|uniref:Secreted protein n=1 Tax=Suillus fuscotomentosus TaxID=1912939 RepID=A0AAD4DZZ3_9AGAM|nr:uncharacterized protein F5891DRAFT_1051117 [Suillus fuscotomentosus]KAG1897020.1 hypothetical protein F5891DRAFT_1051117 [Suillus fuscotomentosus]